MANSGTRKVVLVDVDGKRGSISDALGVSEATACGTSPPRRRSVGSLCCCRPRSAT
ncbi:hypothetical protein ACFQU7_08975 [Pseudoroseomonas wenyumeiae]